MSNSPLVQYTDLSPHYYSRDGHRITDITIHHMAGNLSVETCGRVFHNRKASSNYGIDSTGKIAMYVPEALGSWANANKASNQRSITIELANDRVGGDWHVSDIAIARCIDLCVDICKRNGIKRLNFTGDKTGNLTMHCYFYATGCPGPYLKTKFQYIAEQVNRRLAQDPAPATDKLVVDGLFGYRSTLALQRWLGTYQDGIISGQTKACKPYIPRLISATYTGEGSACIKALQRVLRSKGYNPGSIDGYCGRKTVMALQKYLKAAGYDVGTVDGIFGPATAKALQRYLNTKF